MLPTTMKVDGLATNVPKGGWFIEKEDGLQEGGWVTDNHGQWKG